MDNQLTMSKPISLDLLDELETYIEAMATFYKGANIDLGKTNPRGPLIEVLTNPKIMYGFFVFSCFTFLMITQRNGLEVLILQLWTNAAIFQLITRGVNSVYNMDTINDLLQWYRYLYQPVENPAYQPVIDEHLKKQNLYVKWIIKCVQN